MNISDPSANQDSGYLGVDPSTMNSYKVDVMGLIMQNALNGAGVFALVFLGEKFIPGVDFPKVMNVQVMVAAAAALMYVLVPLAPYYLQAVFSAFGGNFLNMELAGVGLTTAAAGLFNRVSYKAAAALFLLGAGAAYAATMIGDMFGGQPASPKKIGIAKGVPLAGAAFMG